MGSCTARMEKERKADDDCESLRLSAQEEKMTAENEQFFREKINGVREYLAFVKQAYVDEEGNIEMFEYGKAMGCLDAMENVLKEEMDGD